MTSYCSRSNNSFSQLKNAQHKTRTYHIGFDTDAPYVTQSQGMYTEFDGKEVITYDREYGSDALIRKINRIMIEHRHLYAGRRFKEMEIENKEKEHED